MMSNPNWVREPSIQVCAVECGARCCKAPGHILVNTAEMRMMKEEASKQNKEIKVYNDSRDVWAVDFAYNGGQCPLLGEDNLCTIYDKRPDACSKFPTRPYSECLVFPLESEDAEKSKNVSIDDNG